MMSSLDILFKRLIRIQFFYTVLTPAVHNLTCSNYNYNNIIAAQFTLAAFLFCTDVTVILTGSKISVLYITVHTATGPPLGSRIYCKPSYK